MAELIWNINGKYFKDFGVCVEDSKGIMDEPNQKKTDTYDWAEYHGLATNLSQYPKYEAREFELSCWITGDYWLNMRNQFEVFISEFRRAGKQRLLVDVFGNKTYVFDVNLVGKTELKKRFKTGRMFGAFTLKLIEYSPIKKILTTTKPNFQLSFNSPKWVEVNIDGSVEIVKGTVNINKTLPNRELTHYDFLGRNLVKNSTKLIDKNTHWVEDFHLSEHLNGGQQYTIRISAITQNEGDYFYINDEFGNFITIIDKAQYGRFEKTFTYSGVGGVGKLILFRHPETNSFYQFERMKLEKGSMTPYSPAPEDMHFISIAGNIEEITNLTTNADVLWERL